ncbi:MAG TPA: tetratricopeptide repeat protein [Deltaproteobacteria bacterium]|nr:tetratricopeptide repeat protein [Deltaproteobacteria bacterium]HOM28293.1 tetratricopeptide repeat protein [Deltaproteobacteria bacterium]HPP80660.1 tetratricopeptide repeat protein [Deltaproteobacteria bacterium]
MAIDKKDRLDAPDEFVKSASTTLLWIKEHPLNTAVIALVVLGVVASGFGLVYWKTSRDTDAMNALLKATDDYDLTLKVTRDYPGTKADKLARLRLARMSYEKGDTAKALPMVEEFIDDWGRQDTFHWQAVLLAAACHRDQKHPDKALALLDSAIGSAGGVLRDHALFMKGSILLSQGKTDEASQALQGVSENYKDMARSALAASRAAAAPAQPPAQ